MDPGTLEMLLILIRTINMIINQESAVVVDPKRPYAIYSASDSVIDE